MSQLPFLSELNEITVDRPHTLGSLVLALYGHVSPLGKATPRKWLAIFLANRAKSGWYLDPNMPIAAGTTLLVPPAPSAHYPQLIDGTYFNAAFGYRMKLNANWTVGEGNGTAVTFAHAGQSTKHVITTVMGGPNLHYLIDEWMAELAPNAVWRKTQVMIGTATGMKVTTANEQKTRWFVAQYLAHLTGYYAFILDFPGKDAAWLGERFEPFPQYSALQVGQSAKIQTENSMLNMRRVPGLNHEVLQMLPHDTVVTISALPQTVDGYVWWQVCTADQVYGWVVEAVDGIETLVPLES